MNGGLDGRASGGDTGKVYPNNHTIVEGRNLLAADSSSSSPKVVCLFVVVRVQVENCLLTAT